MVSIFISILKKILNAIQPNAWSLFNVDTYTFENCNDFIYGSAFVYDIDTWKIFNF